MSRPRVHLLIVMRDRPEGPLISEEVRQVDRRARWELAIGGCRFSKGRLKSHIYWPVLPGSARNIKPAEADICSARNQTLAKLCNPDHSPTMYNSTWFEDVQRWNMDLFLIPAVTLTALTLVADPLLLACIFCSRALRCETRYLLLANTLAADMVFLAFNMTVVSCNALRAHMPRLACELLTAASITAYCCGILSITLMVLDTYIAVRWPLHYQRLLPPARTRHILLGTWILSTMYPASQVIMMEATQSSVSWDHAPCLVLTLLGSAGGNMMVGVYMYYSVGVILCGSLILYCYARLYAITRTSGIWRSRYSRARVTLLAHATMLLLHFGPGLVFSVELALFQGHTLGHHQLVLMNMLNTHLLTLLPRASAPYLYGLRYRDISDTLLNLFRGRSQVTVA